MILTNLYWKLDRRGALPARLARDLRRSIEKLGRDLAWSDRDHWEPWVNHGFNEAAALLLVASNFPVFESSSTWRVIALERLRVMLRTNIDRDGVDVENSPFYHYYVLGLVSQIGSWAERHEPSLGRDYRRAARRMLPYAAAIAQPDGRLPMLGASTASRVARLDASIYEPLIDANTEFAFTFTDGIRGSAPRDGVRLFRDAGLYILRLSDASSDYRDGTYVTFDSGKFRTSHSQLDAGSITLYSNGRVLLPDSGLYTYDTKRLAYAYFHGTRAHNTVVVDGRDQRPGAAQPLGGRMTAGAAWAAGENRLVPGVTHRRLVIVLQPGLVLVADRLRSRTVHTYTQTWHLAEDLVVNESTHPTVEVTEPAGKPLMRMLQVAPSRAPRIIRGSRSPLQGFISNAYGKMTPATALEYRAKGKLGVFDTVIAAGPYATGESQLVCESVANGLASVWTEDGSMST
jgi:hypothetical protein